jgi:adenylate cyclase
MAAARQELAALLRMFPESNLTYYQHLYHYWRATEREHHLEGLRMAGLTTWPFGFDGRQQDRLDGEALGALTKGTTWLGRHRNGTAFVQEFDAGGKTAYRSANTFLTGAAHMQQDAICEQFDGSDPARLTCGYVYRNTSQAHAADGDYVHVSPVALKYFSLQRQ